jgi:hypothetical protein
MFASNEVNYKRLSDQLIELATLVKQAAVDGIAAHEVPPAAEEGEILVESADGKGVPIRHPADTKPIEDHQPRRGPKPDRKRMATVGSVYSVARFVRTPRFELGNVIVGPTS